MVTKFYTPIRNTVAAKRAAEQAYPTKCCVICGTSVLAVLEIAHLDQIAANNDPDNLAYLCATHHKMFDVGLYPIEAVKLLRAHWQLTKGEANHRLRMKDAGAKAARTRARKAAARKAVATRLLKLSETDG